MTVCRHIKECRRLIPFGEAHLCFTKKKEKGYIQESCWSGAPKPNGIYRYPEDWKKEIKADARKRKSEM